MQVRYRIDVKSGQVIESPALGIHLMQYICDKMLTLPFGAAVFQYKPNLLIGQIEDVIRAAAIGDMIGSYGFLKLILGERRAYQLVQRDGIDLAQLGQQIQIRISFCGLIVGICLTGDADPLSQCLLSESICFTISF